MHGYLILSTIHSAKGQEWKSVFVLNVVDGCIPSDLGTGASDEIEEERRLLYVAMTRAKDDLHLVVPQRFFTHGQNAQGDPPVNELVSPAERVCAPEAKDGLAGVAYVAGTEGSNPLSSTGESTTNLLKSISGNPPAHPADPSGPFVP